jgi:hypothetical protein
MLVEFNILSNCLLVMSSIYSSPLCSFGVYLHPLDAACFYGP